MGFEMNENVSNLYVKLVEQFQQTHGDDHGVFITHKGLKLPKKHIMFVGRETNGIGSSLKERTNLPSKYLAADTASDLEWLVDRSSYYYSRSPFWQVVGKTAAAIHRADYADSIFNFISWSNLYHIAKCKKGARINGWMKKAQRKTCSDLFIEEVKQLLPSAIVFLTDENWLDPFFDENSDWEKLGYIQNYSKITEPFFVGSFEFNLGKGIVIPAIVVPHPQNKRAARGNELVSKIVDYIQSKFAE